MKIRYKGGGSYFHYPHLFDKYNREIEVTKKIGEQLLKNEDLFEEVKTVSNKKEEKKENKKEEKKENKKEEKEEKVGD